MSSEQTPESVERVVGSGRRAAASKDRATGRTARLLVDRALARLEGHAREADGGPNLPRRASSREFLSPIQHTTQNTPEQNETQSQLHYFPKDCVMHAIDCDMDEDCTCAAICPSCMGDHKVVSLTTARLIKLRVACKMLDRGVSLEDVALFLKLAYAEPG